MIKTPCRRALIHAGVYFVGRELTVSNLQDLSVLPALPDHELTAANWQDLLALPGREPKAATD